VIDIRVEELGSGEVTVVIFALGHFGPGIETE